MALDAAHVVDKDPRVDEMVRRWDDLKAARSHHEADWQDIARYHQLMPFSGSTGEKKANKLLVSAPRLYAKGLQSTLYTTMLNPANKWFGMQVEDPERAKIHEVKLWQDTAARVVLASFRPTISSYYQSSLQVIGDDILFGNAANYDEIDHRERRILDVTISLSEIVFSIDGWGRVIEVVRKFAWTGRQAVQYFGSQSLPEKIVDAAEKGHMDKFQFYHHVKINMDWKAGKFGTRGKRWQSLYGSEEGRALVRSAGYDEMPFHTPRLDVETGQTYGVGFGHAGLPNSRVLSQIKDANLRSGQFAADPTLLAPDKDSYPLHGVRRPGEVLYGGTDFVGRQLVQTLDTSRGTGLTLEMQQMETQEIQEIFMWSLTSMVGRTGVTAMESMERQEQYARLMAPYMGRLQEEYLVRKISRRFKMLWRAGQIPPPPAEAEGLALDVKYLSAASMAQHATEGVAALRVVNDLAPLAAIKPEMMDRIDSDELVELMVAARGAPSDILVSREDAAKRADARNKAAQTQQAMQMAQAGAGMMKDVAQAQAVAGDT